MKIVKFFFISLILSLSFISSSKATELIFQFTNPAFGGNPLYGSYYLQSAQMQNIFKEKEESWFKSKSLIERFTDSFTSQLLYRMSDYILDQLFGEDNTLPESPMTYTIGNFRIEYDPSGDYYTFTITDLSTGESSTIQVPKIM
jgi:curli production assembly/transport component CsgF